jgi:ABC-2 type transport system permease protein
MAIQRNGALAALRAFMAKELRHILRDRQTLVILLLLPIAQLVLFGFALRTDVRTVRIVIVEPAPDHATEALRTRIVHGGRFRVVETARSTAPLEEHFRRGTADVALVLERGVAERIEAGGQVRVQVIADAADPNTGTTMQNYVTAALRSWQAELGVGAGGVTIDTRIRMRYNPTLESVNLFVPGLIALILTLVTTLMTAISLSREKERGTLEVLLVSPLHPWQIVVGKVLPYLGLAFANVLTVLVAAWLVFGVPFVGSITLLLAASTLYALVGLALGVVIAAVTSTQLAAMLAALGGTMLPNTLLSGMIFPIASLPLPLQVMSNVVPARWFIVISRGVQLKGAGLPQLWEELVILTVMFLLLMALAIRKFSVRLD